MLLAFPIYTEEFKHFPLEVSNVSTSDFEI